MSIIAGAVVGLFVREYAIAVDPFLLYVGVLLAAIYFFWFMRSAKERIIVGIFFCVLVGFWRGNISVVEPAPSSIHFSGKGIVTDVPVVRGTTQHFSFIIDSREAMQVLTRPYPEYAYGDWLSIDCPKIENDTCAFPVIHRLGQGQGNPLFHILYAVKAHLVRGLEKVLPEPHASFAAALLLGERATMPEELRQAFQVTGTTHIVAVSGMHVVMLSQVLTVLLSLFAIPATARRATTAVFLVLFTAMIGAPASAVRGLVFGLLLLLAESVGRPRAMTMTIATTVAVLLLVSPNFLFDLGFQLSFLAVVGIVYGVPVIAHFVRAWISTLHPWFLPIATLSITAFTATAITTPLLAATFGRISFIGLLANVLVVPFVLYVTIAILITALCAALHPLLAFPAGIVSYVTLDIMMRIVLLLARLPGAAITVTPSAPITLFVVYAFLFSALFFFWGRLTPWERLHSSLDATPQSA